MLQLAAWLSLGCPTPPTIPPPGTATGTPSSQTETPGACGSAEVAYNGIDDDCDAETPDDDLDGDGWPLATDCGDDDRAVHPGAPEVELDGLDNDCDPSTCTFVGFADQPIEWSLPDTPVSATDGWLSGFLGGAACAVGSFAAVVIDATGDGWVDLVSTDACDVAGVGTVSWLVYAGGPGGFAASPAEWSLPSTGIAGIDDLLDTIEEGSAIPCATGWFETEYADLTGDRIPDLAVTDRCTSTLDDWWVFVGTGAGFSMTAEVWPVSEDDGIPFDVTGDGLADYVVVADAGSGEAGGPWAVYAGDGKSFSDASIFWVVPPVPGGFDLSGSWTWDRLVHDGVDSRGYGGECQEEVSIALGEFTGDTVVDLLFTDACTDPTIGTTRWLLHPGSVGFDADGTSWDLPFGVGGGGDLTDWLDAPVEEEAELSCGEIASAIGLHDLTGDGLPDLLVSGGCDPNTWSVYEGTADGFASAAVPLAVPPVADGAFVCTQGLNSYFDIEWEKHVLTCEGGAVSLVLADVDGDSWVDLLAVDAADAAVGRDVWHRYPAQCLQ